MKNIVKRPYRELCDFYKIYNFMVKNFSLDCRRGSMPTFFEYSLATPWSNNPQDHRFAIWEENGEVVAFCWFESGLGKAYFNISDGYEFLIPEMMDHAEARLRDEKDKLQLRIYAKQKLVLEEVFKRGYEITYRDMQGILSFNDVKLNYDLPEGYYFEDPTKINMKKKIDMCWRGFNNSGENPGGVESGYHTNVAPNATPELDVMIKNKDEEYVCYAGMWYVPQNKFAYLEPLCTVPEHRGKGLARAALTELYKRTSKLGATHMAGGSNPFYYKIGYKPICEELFLEKLK